MVENVGEIFDRVGGGVAGEVGRGLQRLAAGVGPLGCGERREAVGEIAVERRRATGAALVDEHQVAFRGSGPERLDVETREVDHRGAGPALQHDDRLGSAVVRPRGRHGDEQVESPAVLEIAVLRNAHGAAVPSRRADAAAAEPLRAVVVRVGHVLAKGAGRAEEQ